MPTGGGMQKWKVLYMHNGLLFAFKMNEIQRHLTTWMNLEKVCLCEINQTEKENIVWFQLYEVLRIDKLIEAERIVSRIIGWENMEFLVIWWEISVWDVENTPEVDCDDDWTKIWMHLCHWVAQKWLTLSIL